MKKLIRFLVSVKGEIKKIRWPKKQEILTYGTATIAFVLTFSIFFGVLDLILSLIKTIGR